MHVNNSPILLVEDDEVDAMTVRLASTADFNPVTGIELGKADGTMARTVPVKEEAETQDPKAGE